MDDLDSPPEVTVSATLETEFYAENGLDKMQPNEAFVVWEIKQGGTTITKDMHFEKITSIDALRDAWLINMQTWLRQTRQSLDVALIGRHKVTLKVVSGRDASCEVSFTSIIDGLKSITVSVKGIPEIHAAPDAARRVLVSIVDYALEHLDTAWPS